MRYQFLLVLFMLFQTQLFAQESKTESAALPVQNTSNQDSNSSSPQKPVAQEAPLSPLQGASSPVTAPQKGPVVNTVPKPRPRARPRSIQTSKIIKETQEEFPLTPEGSLQYAQKMAQELEQIKNIKPEDYIRDIDQYRSSIDKYVEHKKRVCQGEFSTVILGSEGLSKVTKRKRLAPEERKLCFKEMKTLQIGLVNNMYEARKRYLDYIHELRLKELVMARDKVLSELDKTFNR